MSFQEEIVRRSDMVMLVSLHTLLSIVKVDSELLELREDVMVDWDLINPYNYAFSLSRTSL